jgi:4-hydroxy-tetrahydrodipicolinate synthase
MAADTTIKLSQTMNIIGVKEASGNLEQVSRIISGSRKDFIVWSGNDSDTLPMLAIGAYGVISVASHLVGKQIGEMIRCFVEGKTARAAELHRHLMPMFTGLFVVSNPVPVKYAINQVGFRVGKPRLPLCEPVEKTAAQIMVMVRKYKIDLPV